MADPLGPYRKWGPLDPCEPYLRWQEVISRKAGRAAYIAAQKQAAIDEAAAAVAMEFFAELPLEYPQGGVPRIPLPPAGAPSTYVPIGAFAPTRSGFIRATVERLSLEREESRAAALFAELPLEYPQGAPWKPSLAIRFGMVKHTTWRMWYDETSEKLTSLKFHPGGPIPGPLPADPPPPFSPTFRERVAERCAQQATAVRWARMESCGLFSADLTSIPIVTHCCADGRTSGGQTVEQEANPLGVHTAPNVAPNRAAWISERRSAIRRQQQARGLQELSARTDQPMTFEQARNAYLGAAAMIEQGLPLLPPLSRAYRGRGLFQGPSTRANFTMDFQLNGLPRGTNTLEVLYNPVCDEEMEEYRDRGNTAVVIDALEIAIDPYGLPGDTTDLTVVALYGHQQNVERAFIGSSSTFLGNGLSRALFLPGLRYSQEESRRDSIIKLYVASTNATTDPDSILASISVGTLRQHIGPGHNRTIANSVYLAQTRGQTLRATMMGDTVVVAPDGGLVRGTPEANVTIGGSSSLRMTGPLQWERVDTPGTQFSITTRSRSVRVDRNADVPCAPPRMSTTTRGLAGRGSVQVPKDCKADMFLKTLNLRTMISGFSGIEYEKWLRAGLVMPKFKVVVRYPANAFTGLTWVMSFDAYNRISAHITPTASTSYTLSVPHWLLHHKKGTTTCELDYGELCGHALWFKTTTFETPQLHFTCLTGNHQELAADWEFVVDLYADLEPVTKFLGTPNFVYKSNPEIGIFRFFTLPPVSFSLTEKSAVKNVEMVLGREALSGTTKIFSYNQVLLSCLLGFGGILRGRVHFCSPITYGMTVWLVSEWNGNATNWNEVFKYPGTYIEEDGEFEIELRSPYHRVPTRLLTGSTASSFGHLSFYAVSGPLAPKDETVALPLVVELLELRSPDLSAPALPDDYFLWVDFSNFTLDEEEFVIGSRFFDFQSVTCDIGLGDNPFAHMIACHGLHCGTLELKMMWSLKEDYAKAKGSVVITKLCGDKTNGYDGGSLVCSINKMECSTTLFVGNFAGANPNTALAIYSRWLSIKLNAAKSMEKLRILAKPIGNFEFYGRTSFRIQP
uniref:Polyprotein n=1 Tax=Beetleweed nepovirus TaxID=3115756 RepID=A0AAT9J7U2_9SECO